MADFYDFNQLPGDYAGKHPVAANTNIAAGALVALDGAGNLVNATSTVNGFVIGRAAEGADNTGGAAAALSALVARGVYEVSLDATNPPTKAHVGKTVYATTPDTVAHSGTCRAGFLLGFTGDGSAILDTTSMHSHEPVGVHDSDGATLTAAQSGQLITNLGATGAATFVLPAAVPGLEFNFAVKAVQQLRIDPAGTETIELPSTAAQGAAGKYLWADAIGEFVQIRCLAAGAWAVVSSGGTWTLEP